MRQLDDFADKLINFEQLCSECRFPVVFFTGKGGVGKTFVTASIALKLASQGLKTLVVQSAARDCIGDYFIKPGISSTQKQKPDNLIIKNLSPSDNMKDYIVHHLGLEQVFERIFAHELVQSLTDFIPGLAELLLLGRIRALHHSGNYDVILYDGFSLGHFLNLLTTPQVVIDAGFVGPIARIAVEIKTFLADDRRFKLMMVLNPDPLSSQEVLDFIPKIEQKLSILPSHLIINRFWPDKFLAELNLQAEKTAWVNYVQKQVDDSQFQSRNLHRSLSDIDLAGVSKPRLVSLCELGAIDEILDLHVLKRL